MDQNILTTDCLRTSGLAVAGLVGVESSFEAVDTLLSCLGNAGLSVDDDELWESLLWSCGAAAPGVVMTTGLSAVDVGVVMESVEAAPKNENMLLDPSFAGVVGVTEDAGAGDPEAEFGVVLPPPSKLLEDVDDEIPGMKENNLEFRLTGVLTNVVAASKSAVALRVLG